MVNGLMVDGPDRFKAVMSTPNANSNLNRPVHLGRRDVFLEKAMELFAECLQVLPVKKRLGHIDVVLYYVQSSLEPAAMAVKAERADPQEEALIVFLRLVYCYLHSARAMMENESQLDNSRSPLWKFLHRDGKTESSMNFTRSSEQLLQDVAHLFRMAEEPFRDLQKKVADAMTHEDRARYQLAYENLKTHGQSAAHARRAVHERPNFLASS